MRKSAVEVGAQLARHIGHRPEVGDAASIQPAEDLSGVEARVSPRRVRFERGALELGEVERCRLQRYLGDSVARRGARVDRRTML